jgi:hypothetical protein
MSWAVDICSTIWDMNESVAKNTVSLDPAGYVFINFMGDQNYQSIEAVAKECQELIEQLRYEKKSVLGLLNFSGERHFDTGAHKAAMEIMGDLDYDRAAFYGENAVMADVINLIIKARGNGENTKVFNTREEALAWLLMKDPLHGYGG